MWLEKQAEQRWTKNGVFLLRLKVVSWVSRKVEKFTTSLICGTSLLIISFQLPGLKMAVQECFNITGMPTLTQQHFFELKTACDLAERLGRKRHCRLCRRRRLLFLTLESKTAAFVMGDAQTSSHIPLDTRIWTSTSRASTNGLRSMWGSFSAQLLSCQELVGKTCQQREFGQLHDED